MENEAQYDYVVVGSGAGGGPLTCNLVKAGYRVLLLEAGGAADGPNYQVPVFHPKASEDPDLRWDFFVKHYEDEQRAARDPKYRKERGGVLYPRSGTLGGCTAHNAMICVYPQNADWDYIAALTEDPSWKSEQMRGLFERMEDCRYRGPYRFLNALGWNPTRHGFKGWLQTEKALPLEALGDRALKGIIVDAVRAALKEMPHDPKWLTGYVQSQLDPNDWRIIRDNGEGIRFTPLANRGHARIGTREYIQRTADEFPDRLTIELNALATKVLFDADNRAVGVEYLKGERLYRAHAQPSGDPGAVKVARVRREVILSGGAYNTPQLLMLSGIGPREELQRLGIPVRVDRPGVGRNLQDRYEVGMVVRMKRDWKVLEGSRYSPSDPLYQRWQDERDGVYTTNGAVLAVVRRSRPERPLPDLVLFALLGNFRGYYPGYSEDLLRSHRYLTWAVLKAHTNNTAGSVTLRSTDPRDTPEINFRYFEEGNDVAGEDLDSVVAGLEFARKLTGKMSEAVEVEELPGPDVQSKEELRQYVRDQAWGHHASCTCKIGKADDPMAVLDGDFRVYGTRGLRVVDASVFPKIPGFFIVSAVYMVSEKASDVILAEARASASAVEVGRGARAERPKDALPKHAAAATAVVETATSRAKA